MIKWNGIFQGLNDYKKSILKKLFRNFFSIFLTKTFLLASLLSIKVWMERVLHFYLVLKKRDINKDIFFLEVLQCYSFTSLNFMFLVFQFSIWHLNFPLLQFWNFPNSKSLYVSVIFFQNFESVQLYRRSVRNSMTIETENKNQIRQWKVNNQLQSKRNNLM